MVSVQPGNPLTPNAWASARTARAAGGESDVARTPDRGTSDTLARDHADPSLTAEPHR